jgi:pimeloyl-ACP methyl ester carboxylesterase
MLRSIQNLAKSLLLFGLLLMIVSACGQQASPNKPALTVNTGSKLIVYIVGFGEQLTSADAAKNSGYGYEDTFYSQGRVQPYLQATSEFKNAQSLVFSYRGYTGDGKPDQFTCADTYDLRLIEDINSLQTQIGAYLQQHPKTAVYLVAHSLGGVIAFAYMEQIIESTHSTSLLNGGELKGVAILDSPLNGVTSAGGYEKAMIVNSFGCLPPTLDYTIIGQLQSLGATGQFDGRYASILGAMLNVKFVSNQQAAEDAANLGVAILIVGNTHDILWQPDVCLLGPNFLSTQYLSEIGKTGIGALYVRSFASELLPGCASVNPITKANHFKVVQDSDVQKAIWEVFTGQNLDVLTPVTSSTIPAGLPTPTPTPSTPVLVPTPTQPPTPTPTAPSRFQGTLVQAPTTFQVALDITQIHADGSFDGKWYATINGSEEDVIVNGVNVPLNESNRFSQISQDKVQRLQQQFGSNGTLLWFTSTSYDVGQDIWLGCEYYGLLQPNGSVQGVWYPPGSNAEGGTFQLA